MQFIVKESQDLLDVVINLICHKNGYRSGLTHCRRGFRHNT